MENTELFNVQKMFRRDWILFDLSAKTDRDVLEQMCAFACRKGMAKDTFPKAVLAREEHYPTGISMPYIGIAIPHADARHVIKPGIVVAKLAQPVSFQGMGMEEMKVNVSYVFLLLMNHDNHQVFLLQNMMNLCMDEEISRQLLAARKEEEIYDLIDSFYKTRAEY